MESDSFQITEARKFAAHGWIGLLLIAVFWIVNWKLPGLRSNWAFFPLWLGYCLTIDALVLYRTDTSLLTRSRRKYIGLFFISAPVWWIYEAANLRLQNWYYAGAGVFSPLQFSLWATLSFTTVIPAVLGSAELVKSFGWFQRLKNGLVIRRDRMTTSLFFVTGLVMFTMMMIWPNIFFPFIWISLYFILEPINVWLGNRTLADWTEQGDWRPVFNLWGGVLLTAFFWEMWNYYSYPKWIYHIPWGGCCKVFEMPLLGYGGYLPFALELFAIYHFITGLFGAKTEGYVRLADHPKEEDIKTARQQTAPP